MFCPNCGNQIDETSRFCPHCGAETAGGPGAAPPVVQGHLPGTEAPTYLVWSILVTLFCCLPGGIVAIIYSATAMSRNSVGDYVGAQHAAKSALTWIWVSVGAGVVIVIGYAALGALTAAAGGGGFVP